MATVKSLVKSSEAIPIAEEAITICPVEEMGRNSVIPSIIASSIAWKSVIGSRPSPRKNAGHADTEISLLVYG